MKHSKLKRERTYRERVAEASRLDALDAERKARTRDAARLVTLAECRVRSKFKT